MENEILSDNLSVLSSGDELLILSIDIGDGRKERITVLSESSPDQIALDFCSKHRLGAKAKILLTDEIEKNLSSVQLQLKSLPYAAHSGLSTSPGQGFYTPVVLTENTEKLSPPQPEAAKIETQPKILKLNGCLYKNKSPNKAIPTKLPEKKIIPKAIPAKSVHKKSYSNLIKPANANTCAISPNLFQSPQRPEKNFVSSRASPLQLSRSVKEVSPASNKTERIIKKLKFKSYKRIFEKLKPDSNGIISSYTVEQASSNLKELKLISPILEEMNVMNETLNFQEFYDAMEILMKFLTVSEKNSILMPEKVKTLEPVEEAKKTKGRFNGTDLYERGILKKNDTWRRLQQEKEDKDRIELKECFFHPNISGSSRRSKTSSKT